MGDPKRKRKQYTKPFRPWDKTRLDEERELKKKYGLRNKRELWRIEEFLRKKRKNARTLLALEPEERAHREHELLGSLRKYGVLGSTAGLDDVLALTSETFLERRLETVVMRKGLANTAKQARQFVVHGHISINGQKVSAPSYLVLASEEDKLGYFKKVLQIKPKIVEKKDVKKEFEEAAGIASEEDAAPAEAPAERSPEASSKKAEEKPAETIEEKKDVKDEKTEEVKKE
jgi:small subunit ribosomal protein S4